MKDKITYCVYGAYYSVSGKKWIKLNKTDTYEKAQDYVDYVLKDSTNGIVTIKITECVTTFEDIGEWER